MQGGEDNGRFSLDRFYRVYCRYYRALSDAGAEQTEGLHLDDRPWRRGSFSRGLYRASGRLLQTRRRGRSDWRHDRRHCYLVCLEPAGHIGGHTRPRGVTFRLNWRTQTTAKSERRLTLS